jgi:uncharacterized protein (DUF1330 family)
MTAYWVSHYSEILDDDKLAAYAALAGPALSNAGGTFLARDPSAVDYEVGGPGRVVIIEFESVEAATAAHDSEAYQEALRVLDGAAIRSIRIIPGIS